MFILSNQLENVSPAKGSGLSDKQNQDGGSDDMPSIQRANSGSRSSQDYLPAGGVRCPAVALHEGSTLLVVFNALRLLAFSEPVLAAPK